MNCEELKQSVLIDHHELARSCKTFNWLIAGECDEPLHRLYSIFTRRESHWRHTGPADQETIAIPLRKCQYPDILLALGWFMPYSLEFAPAQRIFRCRFNGKVSAETLRDFMSQVSNFVSERGQGSLVGIVDFSEVSAFDLSPQDVRELASLPPVIQDREALRFIIAPSPAIFGLARMFELQGQETRPNLHVVRTAKEVWVILGTEEPEFEPVEVRGGRPDAAGA